MQRIQDFDFDVIRSLFQPLSDTNIDYVKQILDQNKNADDIIVENDNFTFKRSSLYSFLPNNTISIDLLSYMMQLFQLRDNDLCSWFDLQSGGKRIRKRSVFAKPINNTIFLNSNKTINAEFNDYLKSIDFLNLHRLYIPIIPNDCKHFELVIVDITKKSFITLIPQQIF